MHYQGSDLEQPQEGPCLCGAYSDDLEEDRGDPVACARSPEPALLSSVVPSGRHLGWYFCFLCTLCSCAHEAVMKPSKTVTGSILHLHLSGHIWGCNIIWLLRSNAQSVKYNCGISYCKISCVCTWSELPWLSKLITSTFFLLYFITTHRSCIIQVQDILFLAHTKKQFIYICIHQLKCFHLFQNIQQFHLHLI